MRAITHAVALTLVACSPLVHSFVSSFPFRPSKTTLENNKSPARAIEASTGVTQSLSSTATPKTTTSSTENNAVPESTPQIEFYATNTQDRILLLDEALAYNTTAASYILQDVKSLRNNPQSSKEESQTLVEEYLNDLLTSLQTSKKSSSNGSCLPWWSRLRFLSKYSRRARRATLNRVLQLTTPAPEGNPNSTTTNTVLFGQDEEAALRRRRRALLTLLQSLEKMQEENDHMDKKKPNRKPAIVNIEKMALQEFKSQATTAEILQRIPSNLETPHYTVLAEKTQARARPPTVYQIRKYAPFSVATVDMEKPRPVNASESTDAKLENPQLAGASSFGALAGYLFGKNDQKKAMAMTTPVLKTLESSDDNKDNQESSSSSSSSSGKDMAFVLPSSYWEDGAIETKAPQPLPNSGVTLSRNKGGERAVLVFGGLAPTEQVKSKREALLKALEKDGEWKVVEGAAVTLAQYNDPFTPPWKRRNEVSVAVEAR